MVSRPVGEVPEAVQAIARPLHGDEDLDRIVDQVAGKRIVMIGEASHGTHDFYAMRAALTQRLVANHGYVAVCVEGDWPDALRADRYVRGHGDDDSAEESLDSFERFPRWMWRNRDVTQFLDWLRAVNVQRPERERTGFYGLDLYSLHASMQAVIHYLEENDAEAAARAKQRYACFDHISGDPEQYAMQAHLRASSTCESEVVAQLVEMQLRKLARSGRSPSGDAWFHAVQQAHVVRNAEAYFRTMFAGRSASWNLRDTHMMDTIDLVANHLGAGGAPAKVVVWAHNSHVGDARATEMGDDGQITIGQLARQRHPGEVALIGFTTHTGSVIAAHDWEEPTRCMRVRPGLPGSWEELFHEADLSSFYLASADMKATIGESVERIQRAIGVVYRPESERRSHYLHARLADEFDFVIHLDDTRGVDPLDPFDERDAPRLAEDLPETFPTGV